MKYCSAILLLASADASLSNLEVIEETAANIPSSLSMSFSNLVAIKDTDGIRKKKSHAKASKTKSSKVCPDPGSSGSSDASESYPSTKRRASLQRNAQYPPIILNSCVYYKGYDTKKESGTYLHTRGQALDPLSVERLEFNNADLESDLEAKVICASRCEELELECDYFSFERLIQPKVTLYECDFFSKEDVTAKTEGKGAVLFDVTFKGSFNVATNDIVIKKDADIHLPQFEESFACDIPEITGDAITCNRLEQLRGIPGLFELLQDLDPLEALPEAFSAYGFTNDDIYPGLDACEELDSEDFRTYILPAVVCLKEKTGSCLTCTKEAFGDDYCGTGACESDLDVNKITATPCEEKPEGTDGCVYGACGHKCKPECIAQIQTGILCQYGAPLKIGASVYENSCINKNDPNGIEGNFTCF